MATNKIDTKNINALRVLGVDMINKAKSGHPGIVLGAAPILYTLFTRFINIDPENPEWWIVIALSYLQDMVVHCFMHYTIYADMQFQWMI